MKTITKTQVKVIEAEGGAAFEEQMNEALNAIAALNSKYQIHFNMSMGHCAYIEYTYSEQIAENLKDEYELRGERFYCGDCPMFIPSFDGRTRVGNCRYGVCNRPIPSDRACNKFYQKFDSGEWKVQK